MDSTLKELLKTKINSLKELRFQEFINNLFLICHGDNFVIVKQKHDRGSDGILFNSKVIACYAPESYDLSDFKKKISGDYKSYNENWEKTHNNWMVVYNGPFLANMINHVDSLKSDAEKVGIDNILGLIDLQNWTKRNRIYESLGIGSEYIKYDIIEEAIKDIIQTSESGATLKVEQPIPPKDKIEINYTEDQIEDAIDDFQSYCTNASFISDVLTNFNEQYPILISKVKTDFSKYDKSRTFKERFDLIIKDYSEKARKQDDDIYVYYVKMLMLYCFEQCVIGKKKLLC